MNATMRWGYASFSGLLWGLGGNSTATYWYEKSLYIDYQQLSPRDEIEYQIVEKMSATEVSEGWLWGAVASGQGVGYNLNVSVVFKE